MQKKRILRKKTRGFGKGKGANSASNQASAAIHRRRRDSTPAYEITPYTVILGDDGSTFQHNFMFNPNKDYYLYNNGTVVNELGKAIDAKIGSDAQKDRKLFIFSYLVNEITKELYVPVLRKETPSEYSVSRGFK